LKNWFSGRKMHSRMGRTVRADARRQNLTQLREIVKDHAERLCDAMKRDFGKPLVEAYASEIATV
jgi:acyl-CoA reductase-like NAD-dependent aldehyde dehydrogenase